MRLDVANERRTFSLAACIHVDCALKVYRAGAKLLAVSDATMDVGGRAGLTGRRQARVPRILTGLHPHDGGVVEIGV